MEGKQFKVFVFVAHAPKNFLERLEGTLVFDIDVLLIYFVGHQYYPFLLAIVDDLVDDNVLINQSTNQIDTRGENKDYNI